LQKVVCDWYRVRILGTSLQRSELLDFMSPFTNLSLSLPVDRYRRGFSSFQSTTFFPQASRSHKAGQTPDPPPPRGFLLSGHFFRDLLLRRSHVWLGRIHFPPPSCFFFPSTETPLFFRLFFDGFPSLELERDFSYPTLFADFKHVLFVFCFSPVERSFLFFSENPLRPFRVGIQGGVWPLFSPSPPSFFRRNPDFFPPSPPSPNLALSQIGTCVSLAAAPTPISPLHFLVRVGTGPDPSSLFPPSPEIS